MSAESKDPSLQPDAPCPCGSGQRFDACCGPVLAGRRVPATPEELMRARFTAHVAYDFKFLHDTYRATAGKPFVPEPGEPAVKWTRLEVHGAESVALQPDKGFVEFTAHGTQDGKELVHQERAEFQRVDGRWLYTREARLGPAPYKASAPKVGRNDPCPCGSGRKYKHCCLAKA